MSMSVYPSVYPVYKTMRAEVSAATVPQTGRVGDRRDMRTTSKTAVLTRALANLRQRMAGVPGADRQAAHVLGLLQNLESRIGAATRGGIDEKEYYGLLRTVGHLSAQVSRLRHDLKLPPARPTLFRRNVLEAGIENLEQRIAAGKGHGLDNFEVQQLEQAVAQLKAKIRSQREDERFSGSEYARDLASIAAISNDIALMGGTRSNF